MSDGDSVKTLPPTEVELVDALDALVCALTAWRLGGEGGRIYSSRVTITPYVIPDPKDLPPRAMMNERELVEDPVSYMLKRGMRHIGQSLYSRCGGMDRLSEVFDDVCDRGGPQHFERRAAILDSAFGDLGEGNHRWAR